MIDDKHFKNYEFPKAIILQAVYWYLRYALSYRDIEELMAERGIEVDHATLQRGGDSFHTFTGGLLS